MIATESLTATDRDQLERKERARDLWRDGQPDQAAVILKGIAQEEMSPRVAGEVLVTLAACYCALEDCGEARLALRSAEPFVHLCGPRVLGSYYFHWGLVQKKEGGFDDAVTNYTGSLIYWQELGDTDYEIAALINLAELYLVRDDLVQAAQHIERVFKLLNRNSTHICNAYDTQAKILLAEGHLVCAWRAAQRALEEAGENEIWKRDCEATRDEIKKQLLEFLVPITTVDDLDNLKVDMVRYALNVTGGSTVAAARMLNTSHQLIAYIADTKKLSRKPQRRKSIIKLSS